MPTRRANDGELHQHRFFSAVEFVEQRPLNGVAVCERASLLEDEQERRLIWYLHRKSIDPGLPHFARELIAAYPDRFVCRSDARVLPRQLAELCLDPNAAIRGWRAECIAGGLAELIQEFMEREAAQVQEQFAQTSITRLVWGELDRCLDSRRAVLIIGETGIGKSEACRAWCRQHEGQVLHVTLTPVCNRTTFFQAFARALGIAAVLTRTASKLELRVREVLQESGLMVVIEEFHYAFPRCKRPTAPPDLPDWIYSALIDHGVPVALVATPQINRLLRSAEDATGWNGRQWGRRVRRCVKLPEQPTRDDLVLVAGRLLPEASAAMLKTVVGFAGRLTEQFDALRDLIDEARAEARRNTRTKVVAGDLLVAIQEVEGSYAAKAPAPPVKHAGRRQAHADEPLPHVGGLDAPEPQASRRTFAATTRHEDFALADCHK